MKIGMPEVVAIFTTAEPGGSLLPVAEATLERGKGLLGDRYYNGKGTFSQQLKFSRDWEITLIENEEIERFNSLELFAFSPAEFRRNIVTSGVRLNDLVNRRFSVGSAVLSGIRLYEPCAHAYSVEVLCVRAIALPSTEILATFPTPGGLEQKVRSTPD